jgi:cyclase
MHRTLIVARMHPDAADDVAAAFADSDATELPQLIGVNRRTLFRFNGLYLHLVEAEQDIAPALGRTVGHPLFQEINSRLAQYIRPYDPNWREPKDAMAQPFYHWTAGGHA